MSRCRLCPKFLQGNEKTCPKIFVTFNRGTLKFEFTSNVSWLVAGIGKTFIGSPRSSSMPVEQEVYVRIFTPVKSDENGILYLRGEGDLGNKIYKLKDFFSEDFFETKKVIYLSA